MKWRELLRYGGRTETQIVPIIDRGHMYRVQQETDWAQAEILFAALQELVHELAAPVLSGTAAPWLGSQAAFGPTCRCQVQLVWVREESGGARVSSPAIRRQRFPARSPVTIQP